MDLELHAAWHFDRLTTLDEGDDAMRDWIQTFGFKLLAPAPNRNGATSMNDIEERLRPEFFVDGQWYLDYVRIRVKAEFKPDRSSPLSSALMCMAALAPSAPATIT